MGTMGGALVRGLGVAHVVSRANILVSDMVPERAKEVTERFGVTHVPTTTELAALYEGHGVTRDKEVIAYCRIGERSSHSSFVLKYLLGYPNVKNDDGSWTEWGNLVRTPIEK